MKHQNSKSSSIVKQGMLLEFCLMASPLGPMCISVREEEPAKNMRMIYTQNIFKTKVVKEVPLKVILTMYMCMWQGGQGIQFNINYHFKIRCIEIYIFKERIQQLHIRKLDFPERQRTEILSSPEIERY